MVEEIKALKELLDMGAITQEEFDAKKKELLSAPVQIQPTPSPYAQSGYAAPAVQSEKNKMVAGLLAIFLGTLGIHKFYLGYSKEGVIMLLCTLIGALLIIGPFIMAVIALIEGILYLTKSDADFDQIYVKGHKGWF